MRIGIVSFGSKHHEKTGLETICMGLVDLGSKSPDIPVMLQWRRNKTGNYEDPVIMEVSAYIKDLPQTARILSVIDRMIEKQGKKKNIDNPINLYTSLYKKLARHVHWNGAEFEVVKKKKSKDQLYIIESTNYSCSAASEEDAQSNLITQYGKDVVGKTSALKYGEWIAKGAKVIKVSKNKNEAVPLDVYFNRKK